LIELRVFWTAAAGERERETVSHVASVICQNQSQKVETVILNWVIVKGQNPEHWGLCRIGVVDGGNVFLDFRNNSVCRYNIWCR